MVREKWSNFHHATKTIKLNEKSNLAVRPSEEDEVYHVSIHYDNNTVEQISKAESREELNKILSKYNAQMSEEVWKDMVKKQENHWDMLDEEQNNFPGDED